MAQSNIEFKNKHVVRIGLKHKNHIEKLITDDTRYLFGPNLNVEEILSFSYFSYGLFHPNDPNDLIAALCVFDYPNLLSIPSNYWEQSLSNKYDIKLNQFATLWLHLVVYQTDYRQIFLNRMIKAILKRHRTIKKIVFLIPPGIEKVSFLSRYVIFDRVLPRGYLNYRSVQTIAVLKRQNYTYPYKIRRAIEEDNDDVVDILNEKTPILRNWYGEFYIAEIIIHHPHRQILVAEGKNGRAVGVLCVTNKVNYNVLNEEFDLVTFNGFKKAHNDDYSSIMPEQQISDNELNLLTNIADNSEICTTHDIISISMSNPCSESRSTVKSPDDYYDVDVDYEHSSIDGSEDEFSLAGVSQFLISYNEDEEVENILSVKSFYSAVMLDEEFQKKDRHKSGRSGFKSKMQKPSNMPDIPSFFGEGNAFIVELAAAIENCEDCYTGLLEAAFACYPDLEYCLCSLPTNLAMDYEIFKYFTKVPPRPHGTYTHQLYVVHRCSILGNILVREMSFMDETDVIKLISSVEKYEIILDQMKIAMNDEGNFKAFVFLCNGVIIGCATLTIENNPDYLDAFYNLLHWTCSEHHKIGSHGVIENLVICPIFDEHCGFILRELHRLTDFSIIFYMSYPNDGTLQRIRPVNNLIGYLVPVMPRILPEYNQFLKEGDDQEWEIPPVLMKRAEPFSLFLSTRYLTSVPRIDISNKIVVVGTSSTATSFLECLAFGQNPDKLVIFTNLTVVSPHGFSFHKTYNKIRDKMFVKTSHFDRHYAYSTSLSTYVNLVQGVMTLIDRKNQFIGINNETCLFYDYLFLLCGEQFQKPSEQKFNLDLPINVFIINTDTDAGNAFMQMKSFRTLNKPIIVYGHHMVALCCLAALLDFGIPGNQLIYINPGPSEPYTHQHITNYFNNQIVEDGVMKTMEQIGITIYHWFKFVSWTQDSNRIRSIKVQTKYKIVDLECSALFFYQTKCVSTKTFQAITRAGLIFDGHLVIDNNCKTNDPKIYGAGTLTKYSRKYFADHLIHKYFNCEEVGHELAIQLKDLLIYGKEPFNNKRNPIRIYKKPIIQHCQFPGGLNYLSVVKPGKPVPLEVAMARHDYGQVFETGNCFNLSEQGYFRLHLNKFGIIETITCLSKFDINVQSLISIWGKHEKLLNNFVIRFERKQITDLYEYFKQPWAGAIYHDRFKYLLEELHELLYTVQVPSTGKNLFESVKDVFNVTQSRLNLKEIDPKDTQSDNLFNETDYNKLAEEKVITFIEENCLHLPMYANSSWVRMILRGIKQSPLFYDL